MGLGLLGNQARELVINTALVDIGDINPVRPVSPPNPAKPAGKRSGTRKPPVKERTGQDESGRGRKKPLIDDYA